MAEVPDTDTEESDATVITDGYFEEEFYVDAEEAGEFLVELGRQLQEDDEVSVAGDDWEIPFAFGEPVGIEVEFEGEHEPELEFEVELEGRIEDEAPDIA